MTKWETRVLLVDPALLVVDEIGYVPVSRTGAIHFFQFLSGRYGHASGGRISNKSFERWGEISGGEFMTAALIDGFCTTATASRSAATDTACGRSRSLWRSIQHDPGGTRSPPRIPSE